MAIHSNILVWRIQWTEKPGGLQSMGSQRVGHDWGTNTLISWDKQHCPRMIRRPEGSISMVFTQFPRRGPYTLW